MLLVTTVLDYSGGVCMSRGHNEHEILSTCNISQAGVAAPEDRLFDTLASLRDSTDSVRDYLSKAMELRVGADIADRNGAAEKLSLALAKVEVGLGGKPLLFSDDKGMTAFEAEVRAASRACWSNGNLQWSPEDAVG